jgi:hypothetical protein
VLDELSVLQRLARDIKRDTEGMRTPLNEALPGALEAVQRAAEAAAEAASAAREEAAAAREEAAGAREASAGAWEASVENLREGKTYRTMTLPPPETSSSVELPSDVEMTLSVEQLKALRDAVTSAVADGQRKVLRDVVETATQTKKYGRESGESSSGGGGVGFQSKEELSRALADALDRVAEVASATAGLYKLSSVSP